MRKHQRPKIARSIIAKVGAVALVMLVVGTAAVVHPHRAGIGTLSSPGGLRAGSALPSSGPGPRSALGTSSVPASAVVNGSVSVVPGWANITSGSAQPPPRDYGRSFAWDPVDDYLVMFGGFGQSGYLADTWTFHGGKWTHLSPHTSPSARDHATLAWDPVDGYLLLFGGSGGSGDDSDTWKFVGGNWTQLSPSTHPSARWASAMTWDAADQELLLFGGCGGSALGDTWTFQGGNWTQLHPTTSPSPRENVALQFDYTDNYTVLFGGDDYSSGMYGDTWEFLGGSWTKLSLTTHPDARTEASFTDDASLGKLVLFGGEGTTTFSDTWWFSGGSWQLAAPVQSPPARFFGLMAYDPSGSAAVLFGGAGGTALDDTWIYYSLVLNASARLVPGTSPQLVNLSANVTNAHGAVGYRWNLADGNYSSNASLQESYGIPGVYFPSLTAADANGSTGQVTFALTVSAPLTATALAVPTSGPAPLTVDFAVQPAGGSPPYAYHWDSGSGNSSTIAAPQFVYGHPGNFTAVLSVQDASGATWSRSFPIAVAPPLIAPLEAAIVASNTSGSAPWTVWFAANIVGGVGPYIGAWTFGDGARAFGTSASHTYLTAGSFTTTLNVTDARGTLRQATVGIDIAQALWSRVTASPSTVVAGGNVSFTASIGGGVGPYYTQWAFGDGYATAALNTTHEYAQPGTYVATLTVLDSSGRAHYDYLTLDVHAGASPPPSASPQTGSGSSGSMLSDADIIALGILGGAVILALAFVIVRRMDARR